MMYLKASFRRQGADLSVDKKVKEIASFKSHLFDYRASKFGKWTLDLATVRRLVSVLGK